jgi:hypothetical protein
MKRSEMKRVLPLLVLLLVLGLALFGCGKDDANGEAEGTGAAVSGQTGDTAAAVEEEAEGSPAGEVSGGEAVLQQIVDESQAAAEAQNATNTEMNVEITQRGESLVYSYTYLIDLPSTEGMAEGFESTVEVQAPVFNAIVEQLKTAGLSAPTVITEYFTKDGELIWSKEFAGE